MQTVVIRIDEMRDGMTGFPIRLREYDSETGQLAELFIGELPGSVAADAKRIAGVFHKEGNKTHALAEIGKDLHRLLNATEVGREWFELCALSNSSGSAPCLRSYLDIAPVELQRLPWELMTDEHGDPVFLFSSHRPMRGDPIWPKKDRGQDPLLPIRVLVVVCDAHDEDEVKADEYRVQCEVDAIYAGLRKQPGIWQVEVIREPDWDQLKEKFKKFPPHILHFIGETSGTEDPVFKVREKKPSSSSPHWDLRLTQVEAIINRERPPWLFILNACRTTEMAPVERFRRLGTRGVVANQAVIYSDPAVCFTSTFYEKLAENGSLDEAMWEARNKLRIMAIRDYHDWGMPRLTVYGSPDDVIPHNLSELADAASRLIRSGNYLQAELVVDRIDKHQKIWGNACDRNQKRLILLTGWEGAGRTDLLRSCMLTWKLRGYPGVLANMKNLPTEILPHGRLKPGIGEVLMYICFLLAKENSLPQAIVPSLDALMNRVRGIDRKSAGGADPSGPYDGACEKLLGILDEAASAAPLLIALDELEQVFEDHLRGSISEKLLQPIGKGLNNPVSMIISVREKFMADENLDWPGHRWADWVDRIDVKYFTAEDAVLLGHEYGARQGWIKKTHPEWHEMIRTYPKFRGAWPPVELRNLADIYKNSRLR